MSDRKIPQDVKLYDTVYGNQFPDNQYYVLLFDDIPSKFTNKTNYDISIIEYLKTVGFVEYVKIENEKKDYRIVRQSIFVNNDKRMIVSIDLNEDIKNNLLSIEYLYDLNKGLLSEQIDFTSFEQFKREKKKSSISLIKSDMGHLDTEEFDLEIPDMDLELNYGKDFLNIHNIILKRLNKDNDSGIILLHGDPGTGKTTYIKYLTKCVKDKEILFIPPSMAESLSDPSIIPFLMDKRNSVLFIEDGEKVIGDRELSGSSGAVSNILNLTNGILGDCLSIQIIVTFNMKKEKIDQALLRKGRLIVEHKFEKLNLVDTNTLLSHLGKNIVSDKALTLADIYNIDSDEVRVTKENKKIGF